MIGAAILMGSISVGVNSLSWSTSPGSHFRVWPLIAIFIGIGLVSKEIDRRTINILAKSANFEPNSFWGKYAGLPPTLLSKYSIMAGFNRAGDSEEGLALEHLLVVVYFILLSNSWWVSQSSSPIQFDLVVLFLSVCHRNFSSVDIRWLARRRTESSPAILYYILLISVISM